jgi:hypothetical protein
VEILSKPIEFSNKLNYFSIARKKKIVNRRLASRLALPLSAARISIGSLNIKSPMINAARGASPILFM